MRYLRTVLAILIGLSLLSLGLVASLYFIITPDRIQTRLANTLSDHFGVVLEPTAEIKIRRLPNLCITIPKSALRFSTSETASGKLDTVIIRMNPFAYFAKKPRIDDISVTGLSLEFSEDDIRAFLKPRPISTSEIVSIKTLTSTATSIHVKNANGTLVRIDNAQFGMRDITEAGAGMAAKYLLQTKDFTGNADLSGIFDWSEGPIKAVAENVTFSARGLWRGTDITSDISIARLGNPFADRFELSNLDATVKLANGYALRFATPTLASADKRINADGARVSIVVPETNRSDVYLAHGKVNYQGVEKTLAAESLKIETSSLADGEQTPIPNGSISGDIHWNLATGEGRILLEGMFRNTPLKIDTTINHPAENTAVVTLPETPITNTTLAGDTPTADSVDNPLAVDGSVPTPVSATIVTPTRPTIVGEVTLGRLSADRLSKIFSTQSKWLSTFDWQLHFAIGMENAPMGIHHLEGDFLVKDNIALVDNGSVTLKSSSLPYQATIYSDGTWVAATQWRDIESGTFFSHPVMRGLSEGKLDATGNITDVTQTKVELAIRVRDGEMTGVDLLKIHEIMLRERPEKMPREAFNTEAVTSFGLLSLNARLENGVWKIENANVEGPLWKANFSGQSYTRVLSVNAKVNFLKQNGEHAFSMPAVVTIRNNESPVWNPDWEHARADADANLGEVAWSFSLLKKKIEREFNTWWDTREWPNLDLNPSEWLPEFEWPNITYPDWIPDWVPRPNRKDDEAPDLPI